MSIFLVKQSIGSFRALQFGGLWEAYMHVELERTNKKFSFDELYTLL